jgi:hypothetical protein
MLRPRRAKPSPKWSAGRPIRRGSLAGAMDVLASPRTAGDVTSAFFPRLRSTRSETQASISCSKNPTARAPKEMGFGKSPREMSE